MAIYLDTRGHSLLSVALCGRCSKKYPTDELVEDGNSPGLRVCQHGCRDELDPYRLPARQPDRIVLPFCRPDVSIATDPFGAITQDENYFLLTESQDQYLIL